MLRRESKHLGRLGEVRKVFAGNGFPVMYYNVVPGRKAKYLRVCGGWSTRRFFIEENFLLISLLKPRPA